MFYLMTHSTHFIYGYMALELTERGKIIIDLRKQGICMCLCRCVCCMCEREEGNVLFNDTLNTFYLRLYGISINRERQNIC